VNEERRGEEKKKPLTLSANHFRPSGQKVGHPQDHEGDDNPKFHFKALIHNQKSESWSKILIFYFLFTQIL
jgi:hypothetical protein